MMLKLHFNIQEEHLQIHGGDSFTRLKQIKNYERRKEIWTLQRNALIWYQLIVTCNFAVRLE